MSATTTMTMAVVNTAKRAQEVFTPLRWAALGYIAFVVCVALLASWIAPHDPLAQDIPNKFAPIGSPGHLLGTDEFGRDTLSRLIHGAQIELVVAVGATAVAAVLGTLLGLLGGYFGRWVETLTMRTVEVILAFPPVVLALLIVTIYGSGQTTLIAIMGLLFTPAFARLTFGQTLTVRSAEYVDAARAFSAPTPVIFGRVILPNVSGALLAQVPITLANAILLESGLSYLGLGITPPTPSWGGMIASGQRFMAVDPTLLIVTSVAVTLTVLCFGLVGDALRDWLDPKSRNRR